MNTREGEDTAHDDALKNSKVGKKRTCHILCKSRLNTRVRGVMEKIKEWKKHADGACKVGTRNFLPN